MDTMKLAIEITKIIIGTNREHANLDNAGAAEVAEYIYSLKDALDQMEQGKTRQEILDEWAAKSRQSTVEGQ